MRTGVKAWADPHAGLELQLVDAAVLAGKLLALTPSGSHLFVATYGMGDFSNLDSNGWINFPQIVPFAAIPDPDCEERFGPSAVRSGTTRACANPGVSRGSAPAECGRQGFGTEIALKRHRDGRDGPRNRGAGKEHPAPANQGVLIMIKDVLKRLVLEEDGMEMVEWAIVGVVFAVAAAAFWGRLSGEIDTALGKVEASVQGNPPATP